MANMVRFSRPGYDEPVFINADNVTHVTHYDEDTSRVHFGPEHNIVVVGDVQQVGSILA